MVLRRPGMNRSLNRENPDILIMMNAEQQIMRGGGEDKGEKREKEGMGPLKPVTQMSDTAPKSLVGKAVFFVVVFLACDTSSAYEWKVSITRWQTMKSGGG
ncbi:hypothetical protein ACB094_01G008900 [Castanea mollissima]